MRAWLASLLACVSAVTFPGLSKAPALKPVLKPAQRQDRREERHARSNGKVQTGGRDFARDIYRAIRTEDWKATLDAYQAARTASIRLPANCYNGVLNGLAQRADGAECELVLRDMRRMRVEPTEASRTALAKAHALSGDGDKALAALSVGNCTSKLRTYAPVLQCLFKSGRVDDGLRVWREMLLMDVRPSGDLIVAAVASITCPRTLAAFLGALGDVVLSRKHLEAMQESIVQSGHAATFCTVQDGKLGDLPLPSAGLGRTEMERVREGLFATAREASDRQENELRAFDGWLRNHPWAFTACIDGPNVAYLNQNYDGGRFRPLQIKAVVDVLEARGHRVLVTLPAKYCEAMVPNHSKSSFATPLKMNDADQLLEDEEMALLNKWRASGMLYAVPRACHDDLYWILASTYRQVAVSNDRARDHWTGVFASEAQYRRWARAAVSAVRIGSENVELDKPPVHEYACFAAVGSAGAQVAVAPDDDGEWLRADLVFK